MALAAPIPGAAVAFRLPDTDPIGTFADGSHATVVYTDINGRAQVVGHSMEPPLWHRYRADHRRERRRARRSHRRTAHRAECSTRPGGKSRSSARCC